MAKISGRAYLVVLEVARQHGPETFEKISAELCRRYAVNAIYPQKWYDILTDEKDNPFINLSQQLFPGDPLAIRKMAGLTVRENTKKYHEIFLRIASPKMVFMRSPQIWSTIYDTGKFSAEMAGPRHIIFHIRQFPELPHYLREMACGQLAVLGILTNRKITLAHDASEPDDYRWDIQWQ